MRGFFFSNRRLQPYSGTWFSQWVVSSSDIFSLQEKSFRATNCYAISLSLRHGNGNVLACVLHAGCGVDLRLTYSVKDSNLYLFMWEIFGHLETIDNLRVVCISWIVVLVDIDVPATIHLVGAKPKFYLLNNNVPHLYYFGCNHCVAHTDLSS